MIFVESRTFTRRISEFLSDEEYRALQVRLTVCPECGAVIPGCGGLRKVRVGLQSVGQGKRSGARVIYLHIPEADRCEMLLIYGKSERDDLGTKEKAVLAELAHRAKSEAIAWKRRQAGR